MIFKLWNSTKLSHIHFCNTQHVFHFTLLYEVVVKDLERWQNSSSETSGVLTLSDLTEKNPKFFCSNIFPFLTFLVPILNYMHVVIIWEPERCPTICKQNLTTTKSTQDYYYFLWLDKGKHSWKTTYNIQNVCLTYLTVCWMKKIQLRGWDQGGLYLLPQDRRHRKNRCSFSPCSMVCIT